MKAELLPLLDDAIAELRSAHTRFAAQRGSAEDKRSLVSIAPAIRAAYLAVEKLLKHALAAIDPYLVYEELKPVSIRALVKDLRSSGNPSLLASRSSLRTLTLLEAWAAIQELDLLPLDASALGQFGATIKQLAFVRRQVQHAELWATTAEMLSLLEQLFAQVRVVGNALIPDFEARVAAIDPELPFALRAIEEKVDKGWIHLRDLIRAGKPPVFDVKIVTSLRSPEHDPDIGFFYDLAESNYLVGVSLVPRAQASGLFTTYVDRDQVQAREEVMLLDLPVDEVSIGDVPPAPPPSPGIFGILSFEEDAATKELREAIRIVMERKRLAVERFGLSPLEDGALKVARSPVWAHWSAGTTASLTMLSQIILKDFRMDYLRGQRLGHIQSELLPAPSLEGASAAKPFRLAGQCWITHEFVTDERMASELYPAGTVLRYHRARLTPVES
jgi:hypothetical protein